MSTHRLSAETRKQALARWAEKPHLRPATILVAEARTPELLGLPGVVFVTLNQDGAFRVYSPEELPQALQDSTWALTGSMRVFSSLKVRRPAEEPSPLMVECLKQAMRKWGAGAALGVVREAPGEEFFV